MQLSENLSTITDTLTVAAKVTVVEHPRWAVAVLIVAALIGPAISLWVGPRVSGAGQWGIGTGFGLAGVALGIKVAKPVRRHNPPRQL
jgi:hypothetical protein